MNLVRWHGYYFLTMEKAEDRRLVLRAWPGVDVHPFVESHFARLSQDVWYLRDVDSDECDFASHVIYRVAGQSVYASVSGFPVKRVSGSSPHEEVFVNSPMDIEDPEIEIFASDMFWREGKPVRDWQLMHKIDSEVGWRMEDRSTRLATVAVRDLEVLWDRLSLTT